MRSSALLFAAALAVACAGDPPAAPVATADSTSLRMPPAGSLVGFRGEYGAHAWLGVPFAQPPVGALRWRAPEPALAWQGTREALSFGASCPQFSSSLGGDESVPPGTPIGNEDCLFLNVYAPAFEPGAVPQAGAQLPVMFWIHGGGNTIGTSSFYDGGRLAQEERVVVVTTNYRLGPLGWFRHPALAEDASVAGRSGNFALLDLVQGLAWVRDNIAAFGGDPGNVTVFGESAGGRNVVALLLSPPARGLFHRAIVQSGGTRSNTVAEAENYRDDTEPGHANSSREVALRLLAPAAADRAAQRRQVAELSGAEIARRLRELPAGAVLEAYRPSGIGMLELPQVFRDGAVLPAEDFPLRFAAPGAVAPVPIVFGTNRDENKLFLFLDPEYVQRFFRILPRVRDSERYYITAEYQSRSWKAQGADEPALALTAGGRRDVFVYRWDWDEEPKILWADLAQLLGASHGFEIPFVFGHWNLGRQGRFLFDDENLPAREALSAVMRSYWAQFARTGDPGRGTKGELPQWSAWDPAAEGDKFVVLDTESGGGVRMARDVVTNDALLAELRSDPRLADAKKRCALLATLIEWSAALDESDYASGGCEEFPRIAAGE